jgi:hypothetical protein
MGEWRYSFTIFDLGTRSKSAVSFTSHVTSGRKLTLSIGEEAGWAPEPVWTLWRSKKIFPCQESNPGSPARSPSLYRLSYPDSIYQFDYINNILRRAQITNIIITRFSSFPRHFFWGADIYSRTLPIPHLPSGWRAKFHTHTTLHLQSLSLYLNYCHTRLEFNGKTPHLLYKLSYY